MHGCRALVLNRAGTQCASASSDGTVRLWDMGQQRCVSSYAVHDSAVWALAVDPGFTTATSGGRDGCIYRCGCWCLVSPVSLKRNTAGCKACMVLHRCR